jgi:hypothetical protein
MPQCLMHAERRALSVISIRNLLSMTLASTWSSVPTATPKQRTFVSWNITVERTSVRWEMGVGNFPTTRPQVNEFRH